MKLGICTAPETAASLNGFRFHYVEANVQSFLVPEKPEADFEANLAKTGGLAVRAANCFLPGDLKVTGPKVDETRLVAWAESAFRRAKRTGIRSIVFGSGGARGLPEGFSPDEGRAQFLQALRLVAPAAEANGVTVVLEPLNTGECNFINTVAEGAGYIREVGHPNIRLLADFFHMLRDGEGPEILLETGDLLAHVHLAEKEKRTAPGVAGDDFRPFLYNLAKTGYSGDLSIECGWGDLAAEHAAAYEALEKQVLDAGLKVG